MRWTPTLLALALTACSSASAPPPRHGPGAPARSPSPASTAAAAEKSGVPARGPRLEVRIRPEPRPPAHLEVELIAHELPGALGEWLLDGGGLDVASLRASDARGDLAVTTRKVPTGMAIVPAPVRALPLRLRYHVAAEVPAPDDPPPVALDPDRLDARGGAVVALPAGIGDAPFALQLTIAAGELGPGHGQGEGRGASSFGIGDAQVPAARADTVRDAIIVGGMLGHARLDGPEGHDEAAWFGFTAFDPRLAVADIAAFRTAFRQLLGERGGTKGMLVFAADSRPSGAYQASRHGQSVLLRIGVQEPWTGPVRIATTTEVLHEWLGGRIWIGPSETTRAAEGIWFSDGVTRSVARDLLHRYGLITSAELAAEVEGLVALAVTSPLRGEDHLGLVARAAKRERGAVPLLVARGALYALRIDALIRARSRGKRSFDDVLRALYAAAAARRGPLPTDAWKEALAAELGGDEAAREHAAFERGAAIALPAAALGPCFAPQDKSYAAFDRGFDLEATRDAPQRRLVGLNAQGPAARAGARDGDTLASYRETAGRSDVAVELVVTRDGQNRTVRYEPAGTRARGPGFRRKTEVPETSCAR